MLDCKKIHRSDNESQINLRGGGGCEREARVRRSFGFDQWGLTRNMISSVVNELLISAIIDGI